MPDPELVSFLPLSTPTLHILLALAGGDRHGYAVMREIEQASNGTVKVGPATLYRVIESLLESGLIAESERLPTKDEDQRRRYYRLSSLGLRVLSAESERLAKIVALARNKKVLRRPV